MPTSSPSLDVGLRHLTPSSSPGTASLDQARLLNGADVFAWNHDKRYLADLGDLPAVPTLLADDRDEPGRGRTPVRHRGGQAAGGRRRSGPPRGHRPRRPAPGPAGPQPPRLPRGRRPWVVQPLVESIRTHGESRSTSSTGGSTPALRQAARRADDVRVNEEFGGRVRAVGTGDVGDLVMTAYDAMTERFGRPMDYLRVDLLRWDGDWVVSELELIEPGLYLEVSPANAGPFADLGGRAGRRPRLTRPRRRRLHSRGSSAKHEAGTLVTRVTTTQVTLRSAEAGVNGSPGERIVRRGQPAWRRHTDSRRQESQAIWPS